MYCTTITTYHNKYRVFQKKFTLDISIISLAINMLEGCDISHLKGGIHNSIWSTKTFLYDIREPRYKQNHICGIIFEVMEIEYLEI